MMSGLFNLNKRDAINGFIVAFLSAALTGTLAALDAGELPSLDALKSDALFGLKAAGAYLLKNLFTNSQDKFLVGEK
jgi:N-acetylmuramic acid 6-phosphate (MurNAc-6-P) etherase